jgi:hypothetical protein
MEQQEATRDEEERDEQPEQAPDEETRELRCTLCGLRACWTK